MNDRRTAPASKFILSQVTLPRPELSRLTYQNWPRPKYYQA